MRAGLHPDAKTGLVLRFLIVWRALFGLGTAIAALRVWMPDAPRWQTLLASSALALAALLSFVALGDILKRNHRGRTLSLILDYLAFVACAIHALNIAGVFVGIDALADRFPRAIPGLGVVFAGYLLNTYGVQLVGRDAARQRVRLLGYSLMAGGGLFFLWRVETLQGLLHIGSRLVQPNALSTLAIMLPLGMALWGMWRLPTAQLLGARSHHEQMLNGWLFLSPNLLGFCIFFAGPLLLSFYFSFTDSDAIHPPRWVGLANYAELLDVRIVPLQSPDQPARDVVDVTVYDEVARWRLGNRAILFAAADRFFWLALRNTLTYALCAVPLSVVPALFLANILNSKLPGMKFFRAIYFLPSIAAIVGIALVWQWLYNATIGYINYFITLSVNLINSVLDIGLVDPKIRWVSDERTALLAVIIIGAWQTMGFNTVLFLAGLQNIPKELYEAATVDGAGAWARFRRVTIPLLAPSTFYVLTISMIQAMQVFEQVFILMNPPEGPNNATITLVLYLYRSGFINFKQGYASAIAWVLFVVIFGLTLVQYQRQRRASIYEN